MQRRASKRIVSLDEILFTTFEEENSWYNEYSALFLCLMYGFFMLAV